MYKSIFVKAQNIYIQQKADEICEDPLMRMQALVESFHLHPLKTAVIFDRVSKFGLARDLVDLEDLLRKSAECLADEEWHKQKMVREAA